MNEEEFLKEFPSLGGFSLNKVLDLDINYKVYMDKDIKKHCLDKQKLMKGIKEFIDAWIKYLDSESPNLIKSNRLLVLKIAVVCFDKKLLKEILKLHESWEEELGL